MLVVIAYVQAIFWKLPGVIESINEVSTLGIPSKI
jgi:hypothetical protein